MKTEYAYGNVINVNEENLKHFPRLDETSDPLSDKPTQVRLPVHIAELVNRLGREKTPWLRRIITEAAERELMAPPDETA